MFYSRLLVVVACSLAFANPELRGQDNESKPKFNLLRGPTKAPLGNVAQVELPVGYVFLNGKDYQKLLKAEGEPVSGNELGLMRATNENWSVVFEFSDIGYVKDDEKDKLDPDKLLASIRSNNDAANKERVRAGNPPLEVIGWEIPPKYDATTHNLEWAIRGAVEGQPILNYNTRLLGRKGVMEVVLIVKPDQLTTTLPTFRNLLAGYSFQTGNSYAEYRQGDKIAKYGLGALVVGARRSGRQSLASSPGWQYSSRRLGSWWLSLSWQSSASSRNCLPAEATERRIMPAEEAFRLGKQNPNPKLEIRNKLKDPIGLATALLSLWERTGEGNSMGVFYQTGLPLAQRLEVRVNLAR